jgi:hypothetical protein
MFGTLEIMLTSLPKLKEAKLVPIIAEFQNSAIYHGTMKYRKTNHRAEQHKAMRDMVTNRTTQAVHQDDHWTKD